MNAHTSSALQSKTAIYVALAGSITTIAITSAYAIAGILNKAPVTVPIFFAAQILYFITNSILLYLLWTRRESLPFLLKIFLISWAGVIAWYTLPMATLALLTISFDELQLKWLMFAWMWELPVSGAGLVGIYAVIFALRINKLIHNHYKTDDFKRTYRYILRYPIAVAVSMVIIGGISFTAGAVQLGYFANLPVSEQFKMLAFGLGTAIFFSIFIYLAYDHLLRGVRHDLELTHPGQPVISRKYARRMFFITLLISFGSLVMVGLVVVRSYQYFTIQEATQKSLANIQLAQFALSAASEANFNKVLSGALQQLRPGPSDAAFIVRSPSDLEHATITAATATRVLQQKAGIIHDAKDVFKVVSFFTEGRQGQKIVVITQVGNFFGPISASLRYFILGGSFIMILTASITGFASANLTRSIRQLSQAVRRTQEGHDAFMFDTGTADELEDLAHSFAFYINQSQQLQHTLEQKVQQRTAALMRIEEEKRQLEVESAQKVITAEQEKRQTVEAANKQLEERVEQRTAQLEEAVQRLQELDKLKTEFISIASHQLRTPLTVVRWAYHALLDDTSPAISDSQKQMASAGLKKTLFMIRLVNELLDVVRIEQNTITFTAKEVAIDRLVKDIIEDLRETAAKK
ncbi:MAG: hypothetical protein HYZ63_00775, partial [Candidatus Andersenbacteria bacterium]|nr:hypothetical protein [Candidatus Andersenbacteria bacterium]